MNVKPTSVLRVKPRLLVPLASVFLAAAPLNATTVAQWDRFETALTNTNSYRDPFLDVTLDAIYTRPDGSAVRFLGFYDGHATWRIRFMPDQIGVWKYEAAFSDGTAGTSGVFECVKSGLPGLIGAYEANSIWFGFKGGGPLLVRSFHCGDRFFAKNWDDPGDSSDGEKRKVFLDWAQTQGYNTLSIASHYLNRDSAARGRGWTTPRLWPLDAAEFRWMETILDDLAARRIIVFPFAGFFGRESSFPGTHADQTLYLRYTLARLSAYWNLLFNVGGPEPLLRGKPFLSFADIRRLGGEIRALDVPGHALTVHNATGDDVFRGEPWFGFGTLQGPKTTDRRRLAEVLLRNHHPARPLYAQETLWPGNTVGHPAYSDEDIRRNAFTILFSAAMINYGDMAGNSSSGFSNTLDPADAVPSRHAIIRQVWDTFAPLPWANSKPRQDLVNTGHCLADPGRSYLVYVEQPGPVQVKIERGPFAVEWINAREPSARHAAGQTEDGQGLIPPGDGDWVLVLRRGKENSRSPTAGTDNQAGTCFPPPGESLDNQVRRAPSEVGMDDSFVAGIKPFVTGRWALWRDGYLVHVQGDFNQKMDVASLRKTLHALIVGAAIQQGRIPGLDQKVSAWVSGFPGRHADATWWNVITQTSGFDYPYANFPAFKPGEMWTYSDKNPRVLCNALARVYGKQDFNDNYADVAQAACFGAIGMRGWAAVPKQDGVRFQLDLEDMGRLGLLVLNRGRWEDQQLIPQWFVEQLERKQTGAIRVNYNGPDDGRIELDPEKFPEVPYGFMTWVNSDGDFYPGADKSWAWGAGAGGTRILWNRHNGVVFAGVGVDNRPSTNGIPHAVELAIRGENPLMARHARATVAPRVPSR